MNGSSTITAGVDPELVPGARNAVRVCLRIEPREKVTLITDEASREIAASLEQEIERVGAPCRTWVLEKLAPRPLRSMPRAVLEDLETSQVSLYAVWAQENELASRIQMTDVVDRRGIRHAHMVNINRRIMMEGMRADFRKVDEISRRVLEIVSAAQVIRATTPAGTDLACELNPEYHWVKTSGIISAKHWGNLPGGEVFTTPESIDGTLVVDGVVGDYLCAKFGNLRQSPLTLRLHGNRLMEARCSNPALEREFWEYTHQDENSDRVGELAIGTNIALPDVIGNILQDEKVPGLHIAFGNPYGEHTGARWASSSHIDVVGTRFTIWADDRLIMRDGQFFL